MMHILFVYPDLASDITNYTGVTSYGLSILSAICKREGYTTELLHITSEPTRESFQARVRQSKPDLVAISTNSHYARRLHEWTEWAGEACPAPIAVGGVHPTLAPDDVIALPHVSYVCIGEGEEAFLELCRALDGGRETKDIRNFWVKQGEEIYRNEQRPLIPDLDALPEPDYDLFEFANLYPVRRGLFPFIMSRGCAFRCTYCSVHALRNLSPGGTRFWRFLSPRQAAEQLRDMIGRQSSRIEQVQFLDAIFFPSLKWLKEFSPLYKELVGLPFSCNMRADFVTAEVAGIMADMGCHIVRFGVESGDEQITREVLDRALGIEDIRQAFTILRRFGIERWSYNIVGLPGENLQLALKTIRLNAEIDPELALAFIFYPYPGTVLFDLCREKGYLTDREFDHYFQGVATCLPDFSEWDILFLHRFFRTLIRIYQIGDRWSEPTRRKWLRVVDAGLASPLLPRQVIIRLFMGYRGLRHAAGGFLVSRSTRVYKLLGGTDPV